MTDDEMEMQLRQMRPAGPPPELDARIVRLLSSRPRRMWPGVVAASLLLGISMGLSVATERLWVALPAPATRLSPDGIARLLERDVDPTAPVDALTEDALRIDAALENKEAGVATVEPGEPPP